MDLSAAFDPNSSPHTTLALPEKISSLSRKHISAAGLCLLSWSYPCHGA